MAILRKTAVLDPIVEAAQIAEDALDAFSSARDNLLTASAILENAAQQDEALIGDLQSRVAHSRQASERNARAAKKIADLFE